MLIFVYEKTDNSDNETSQLDIQYVIFVEKEYTADYQTTKGLLEILKGDGIKDDLVAFIMDKNLPVNEVGAHQLADEILDNPPNQGYLTISNALQWRLQYSRVIQEAGQLTGIFRVR